VRSAAALPATRAAPKKTAAAAGPDDGWEEF
jgi:hypothetical protein